MSANKWKRAFFLLLGLVLFIIIVFIGLIFWPVDQGEIPKEKNVGKTIPFHLETNKEDLNKVINSYIAKEKGDTPIDYYVNLKDDVELTGKLDLFSTSVHFNMTFEPKALKNGDIVLKQKGMSLGELHLPPSYVLKIAQESYHFPDWVRIFPNQKMIYVSTKRMNLKNNVSIRVNEFNLPNDRISFTLLVPVQ
ncbi:YpmS family protein [Bacillus smithii]|uniref:YpmS family protein n=1 Tax=Bacillus smithii TaxID=1479 RepID=UPI002E1DD3EA|nr:YpmS family protein [Bacillus smithii]